MATHSSILTWSILWTEEPGGLQSMELQSWTRLSRHTCTHRVLYLEKPAFWDAPLSELGYFEGIDKGKGN